LPVYNEANGILKLYNELSAVSFNFELLKIVYDFDGDSTEPYIKMLTEKDPRVVGKKTNLEKE